MAKDRRERFASLVELRDAIDGVQKPIAPEQERHAFASLLARSERWGGVSDLDRAALAKLIEQTTHLHRQVEAVRVGMAEVQREQRELEARFRRMESGGKTPPVLAPRPRSWPAGLLGGFLGAVAAVAAIVGASAYRERLPQPVLAALASLERNGPAPHPVEPKAQPEAKETADPKPAAAAQAQPAALPAGNSQAAWVIEVKPAPGATAPLSAPPAIVAAPPEAKPAAEQKPAVSSSDPPPKAAAPPLRPGVALLQRGERELERGRVDAAIDAFRLALQDDPKLAAAWRGLGTAYVLRHKNDSALAAYEKYLQLSPAADDRADIRRAMAELKSNATATADK
jgi:hypothetical protein